MPARIISGENLWKSSKLKKVPVQFRAEYANLLPLAEANGSFECDPEMIWSEVYSYNRTDITPVIVAEILDEFEKAAMLQRYEVGGKIYGFWVGIDKEGRLPSPSQRSRYKNLPPEPPSVAAPQAGDFGSEISKFYGGWDTNTTPEPVKQFDADANLPLESRIEKLCNQTIGFTEERKLYSKDLKAAVKQYGHDEVWSAFELWISTQSLFSGKRPITSFLKSLSTMISVGLSGASVTSPALSQIESEIAALTDSQVFFHTLQKPLLASLVKTYSLAEVMKAFRDFWTAGTSDPQWAGKNFIEQAALRIETERKKKSEQEQQNARVAGAVSKLQSEISETEEEEVEDEL